VADTTERLRAADIITAIKSAGIRFVVALPDRTTSEHLLKPLLTDPELRVVQVCKEDEGVSICSGLYAAGQRALLLMQHTGLLDSINALRGVAVEGHNPVCMMVGLLSKEPGVLPTQSQRYGIRVVEPVLDAMQIEHHLIEAPEDVEKIVPAIEAAYAQTMPVVLLIGREPL
jgi:sulfopyruvate decarboxylase subunit alpha